MHVISINVGYWTIQGSLYGLETLSRAGLEFLSGVGCWMGGGSGDSKVIFISNPDTEFSVITQPQPQLQLNPTRVAFRQIIWNPHHPTTTNLLTTSK